jgi:hypothetical protein
MSFIKKRQILPSFGKASLALTDFLREAETLDFEDQIFIENHLVILQLAYSTWKRGHHEEQSDQSCSYIIPGNSGQTAA